MSESAPQPNVALAEAIELSGLKKGFIARQIGVHQSMLSHWLRGVRTPDTVQLEKLALLLRCAPDELDPSRSMVGTHQAHGPELCASEPDARTDHGTHYPNGRAA